MDGYSSLILVPHFHYKDSSEVFFFSSFSLGLFFNGWISSLIYYVDNLDKL